MAAASKSALLWTPTAILSLRCQTAIGSSRCATMAAEISRSSETTRNKSADTASFLFTGTWATIKDSAAPGGSFRSADQAGATMTFPFSGNQVRLLGVVGPEGGWAEAFLDGVKQPTLVECWNPTLRHQQPIFLKSGLANGPHELKIVARGEKNPLARGARIGIESALYSAATGDAGFGSGGGPKDAQRLIFGYTGREDYIDSQGNAWRPGTEFVARVGAGRGHRRAVLVARPPQHVYRRNGG